MAKPVRTRIRSRGRLLAISIGAAAIALGLGLAGCRPQITAFREVPVMRSLNDIDLRSSAGAYRQHLVELEPGTFEALAGPKPKAQILRLNLFSDTEYPVFFDDFEDLSEGETRRVLYGGVSGSPGSRVVIALRGEVMAARVTLANGEQYTISHAGSGVHRIQEVDPAAFHDEEGELELPPDVVAQPIEAESSESEPLLGSPDQALDAFEDVEPFEPAGRDLGSVIDLMVVYSEAAKNRFGGDDGIGAEILAAVGDTNQAYAASGVTQSLRLVHTAEVEYQEVSTDTIRQALDEVTYESVQTVDGVSVDALRDAHGADQVSFWVYAPPPAGASTYVCGRAWVPDTDAEIQSMAEVAFNAVNAHCDVAHSMAHELAHNQGAQHDPGTLMYAKEWTREQFEGYANAAPDWVSFGYCDPEGRFATIMAYGFQCVPKASNVMRYSSSSDEHTYLGYATGDSWSDVRSTLNATYPVAVNWRDAVDLVALNDDLWHASPLVVGFAGWVEGANRGATSEPGEPLHAGRTGGASVWWEWRTDFSGWVTVDTFGSDFDTLLAVYEGPHVQANPSDLVELASDDNWLLKTPQSRVHFEALAGHAYYIAVDGYRCPTCAQAETGNIELHLEEDVYAPVAISPEGPAWANAPVFIWEPVPGATKYELRIEYEDPWQNVNRSLHEVWASDAGCDSGQCQWQGAILDPESYRWWVRPAPPRVLLYACEGSCPEQVPSGQPIPTDASPDSDTLEFEVVAPPTRPVAYLPAGSWSSGSGLFQWSPSDRADNYVLMVISGMGTYSWAYTPAEAGCPNIWDRCQVVNRLPMDGRLLPLTWYVYAGNAYGAVASNAVSVSIW